MRSRSSLWESITKRGRFDMETKAVIGETEYTAISAPVIDRALMTSPLSVGNCNSATLSLSILTDDEIAPGAAITIQGRVTNGTDYSEWLPFGTFYIDQRDTSYEGLITVSCYDAMAKASQDYIDEESLEESWPKTMSDVVTEIASRIGVELDSRTSINTGDDYVVTYPSGLTMLQVLGYIGACHGGNWIITEENKLRLVLLTTAPDETNYIISYDYENIQTDDGYTLVHETQTSSDSDTDTDTDSSDQIDVPAVLGQITTGTSVTVTGVTAEGEDEDTSYAAGDSTGEVLDLGQNPYVTQAICDDLLTLYNGLVYSPFTATNAIYDPTVELGDQVKIGDRVFSVLMATTLTLDTGFRANVSAPNSEKLSEEYPYLSVKDELKKTNSQLRSYIKKTESTEASLKVLEGEIESKVSSEEVEKLIDEQNNELGERITNLETSIDQTSSEILLQARAEVQQSGQNLIGQGAATDGYSLDSSGAETADDSSTVSDYIYVIAGEPYTLTAYAEAPDSSSLLTLVWYDEDKTFISRPVAVTGWEANYSSTQTAPENAAYARVSFPTSLTGQVRFEWGSVSSTGVSEATLSIVADGIKSSVSKIETETTGKAGQNLIIQDTVTSGYRINNKGSLNVASAATTTDYISVLSGENYTLTVYSDVSTTSGSHYVTLAWYDEDKTFISRAIDVSSWDTPYINTQTAPDNAAYARLSFPTDLLGQVRFELGSTSTAGSAEENAAEIQTTNEKVSTIEQTAESITTQVSSNTNAISEMSQTAQGWDWTVTKDEVTAALELKVSTDDNDQIVSMLNASADQISITGDRLVIEATNFKLTKDGTMTVTNGNFTGTITATSGSFTGTVTAGAGSVIGGWSITDGKIYAGDSSTGVAVMQVPSEYTTYVFAAGGTSHESYADCPFRVSKKGTVFAYKGVYFGSGDVDYYIKVNDSNELTAVLDGNVTVQNLKVTSESIGFTTEYGMTDYIAIYCQWVDESYHNILQRDGDGLTARIGWSGSSDYSSKLVLRGRTVQVYNSSGTSTLSDERLKKDWKSLDDYDAFFDALNPQAFRYKNGESGRYHLGFGAQSVEQALADSGLSNSDFGGIVKYDVSSESEDYNGYDDQYSLIYTEFVALLTDQVQKLKAKNAELEQRMDALEQRLARLEGGA